MTGEPQTTYAWFTRSADRFDASPALEVGAETLTYRQLRHLAERFAARLLAANDGVAPARVGLLASRSVTAYVGYLAIARLGAVVVPLNPESPPARNAAVAAAAGLDLAVADAPGADLGVPLLVADSVALAAMGAEPFAELPACPATPDDVAYVIFTSGSTGNPKGVPILHRNVSAYLTQMVSRYEIGPGSRLSQAFDLTFDGSVHDLFVAWACGGHARGAEARAAAVAGQVHQRPPAHALVLRAVRGVLRGTSGHPAVGQHAYLALERVRRRAAHAAPGACVAGGRAGQHPGQPVRPDGSHGLVYRVPAAARPCAVADAGGRHGTDRDLPPVRGVPAAGRERQPRRRG